MKACRCRLSCLVVSRGVWLGMHRKELEMALSCVPQSESCLIRQPRQSEIERAPMIRPNVDNLEDSGAWANVVAPGECHYASIPVGTGIADQSAMA